MTHATSEERFRQAAEAEGGMPVSAGARVTHFRMAADSGRVFHVDLTNVPEDRRLAVVDEIKALVERASVLSSGKTQNPARASVDLDG